MARYGQRQGERYVGFTTMVAEPEWGCDVSAFIQAALGQVSNAACDQQQLGAFKQTFAHSGRYGVWQVDGKQVYFSGLDDALFPFILKADGGVIKIDSDFLDEPEMKALIDSPQT